MEQIEKILIKLVAWFLVSIWFVKKIHERLICIANDTSESIYDLFLNFRIKKALGENEKVPSLDISELTYAAPSKHGLLKLVFKKYNLSIGHVEYLNHNCTIKIKALCNKCGHMTTVTISDGFGSTSNTYIDNLANKIHYNCKCR